MKFERTRAYTRHQRQRTMRRKMNIAKHAWDILLKLPVFLQKEKFTVLAECVQQSGEQKDHLLVYRSGYTKLIHTKNNRSF